MRKNYEILMIDKKYLMKKMDLPGLPGVKEDESLPGLPGVSESKPEEPDDKEPDDINESEDYKTGFLAGYEAGTKDAMKKE
jgi:hypothetical protein